MGNYFNELRWKIIRTNNLLQFIHQVIIEIRFWKSLAQERFKSNLEFRNQIIVSSIKFMILKEFWYPSIGFSEYILIFSTFSSSFTKEDILHTWNQFQPF